jgi:hypothetical protein
MPSNLQSASLVMNTTGETHPNTFQRIDEDGVLPAGDVLLTLAQIDRLSEIRKSPVAVSAVGFNRNPLPCFC